MLKNAFLGMLVLLSASIAGASTLDVSIDLAASNVTFDLKATMHTVHGTVAVSGGRIQIDPGTGRVSGEIFVDATSAETGNKSRDKKMHAKVLLSADHPVILLRPDRIDGELNQSGESTLTLGGVMELAGSPHSVSIPINVGITGDHVVVDSTFEVPYVEWGLKDPSNFALRVAKVVVVSVHLEGLVATLD